MKKYSSANITPYQCGFETKPGRPSLIGSVAEETAMDLFYGVRNSGAAVSGPIFDCLVKGAALAKNPSVLKENGGTVTDENIHNVMKYLKEKYNIVLRRGNKSSVFDTPDAPRVCLDYNLDCLEICEDYNIVCELVINWDELGLLLCPAGNVTLDTRGLKDVKISNKDDKRQITNTAGVSLSGHKLKMQSIYQGKIVLKIQLMWMNLFFFFFFRYNK